MSGVNVTPGRAPRATHDISFSDGVETWGAILDDGPKGIREVPQTPSTLLANPGQGKYGDYDPTFTHIEQRDWSGGRGQEEFVDDPSRFFDAAGCWTLTPGRLLPGLQWKLDSTFNPGDQHLPGDVTWKALTGDQRYLATYVLAGSSYAAEQAYLWIRRRGSPGTLTVELRTDNAGQPNVVLQTATTTISTVTDTVSVLLPFNWTGTESLTAASAYHVVIYGASTDSRANHWEVGCDAGVAGKSSTTGPNGSGWSNTTFSPYYWLATTLASTRTLAAHRYFVLEGALYMVTWYPPDTDVTNAANSTLWINGDRGNADANTGALTTLVDATKSWTTDQWANAYAKIVAGPGYGEWRKISSNTGTTLTLDAAWNTEHTTSTRYVIYATKYWSAVTTDIPADFQVSDVAVCNSIAFFARGGDAICQFRDNAGTPDFDTTETATARMLHVFHDPNDGTQMWRMNWALSSVSRATPSAFGAAMTFGSAIQVGDTSTAVMRILDYNDRLFVLKEDSIWAVKNDKPAKLAIGLDAMPSVQNGIGAAAHNLFLYFAWGPSLERLYGGTLDDVGPWKGAGLPEDMRGVVSWLEPAMGWLFAAIDAGPDGFSSIQCWDGAGWHEIFRCWETGRRIRHLKWVAMPGTQPRLYFSCGAVMCYVEFPRDALHPLRDDELPFMHEAVLTTSTIDLGAAVMPKFIKSFTAVTEKLGRTGSSSTGREMFLDYQLDDQIGGNTWIPAGALDHSPVDSLGINQGNIHAVRFRLRINTGDAETPVVGKAWLTEMFARTPVKYQYQLRVKVSSIQRNKTGQRDSAPDAFVAWLKRMAGSAGKVRVRSLFPQWDDRLVIIEPPTVLRSFNNKILGWWGGVLEFTVRDA